VIRPTTGPFIKIALRDPALRSAANLLHRSKVAKPGRQSPPDDEDMMSRKKNQPSTGGVLAGIERIEAIPADPSPAPFKMQRASRER
jgi:hypothetical protein